MPVSSRRLGCRRLAQGGDYLDLLLLGKEFMEVRPDV
jgi:hypothetical protein